MEYRYGMPERPFDISCQPMNGLVDVLDGGMIDGRYYWNVLVYSRELTKTELDDYELVRLD